MDAQGPGLRPHHLGDGGDASSSGASEPGSARRGRRWWGRSKSGGGEGASGDAGTPVPAGSPAAPAGVATPGKASASTGSANTPDRSGGWLRRRRDRVTAGVALALVGGLVAASVVVGVGAADAIPRLGDLGTWLSNSGNGTVSHVNGPTGRTDGRVAVPGTQGHPVQVAEDGSSVLVVDQETGVVSRVDPAELSVPYRYDYGAPGLRLATGGGAAWLVDEAQGTVRPINPADLTPLAPAVDLGDKPLGRAQADSRATLWVPLPGKGQVVPVRGAVPGAPVRVAEPGGPLRLTLAGDRPVVTDPRAKTVTVVEAGGPTLTVRLPDELGNADPARVLTPETTPGALVPVLAGDTGTLVLADLDRGSVTAVPLGIGGAAGSFAPPQVLGSRVYIPDRAHGFLLVYDTAKAQFEPQIKVTGQPGPLESFVRDGMLWVNDRNSSAAAVVDASGVAHPVGKYADDTPEGTDGEESGAPPQVPGDPAPPARDQADAARTDPGADGSSVGGSGGSGNDADSAKAPGTPSRPAAPVAPPAPERTGPALPSGPPAPRPPGPGEPTAEDGPGVPTGAPVPAPPAPPAASSTAPDEPAPTTAAPTTAAPTTPTPPPATRPPTTSPPATSEPPPATTPPAETPPPAPVTPPGRPEATSGPGRIVLTFAPSAGARPTGYSVAGLAAGQTASPTTADADGPFEFTVSGGSCDTEYGFKIVAHYADGRTATSPGSTPVRPCTAPGSVGKVRATPSEGGHGGRITWDAAPGNGSAKVWYSVEVDGASQRVDALSHTLTGLENGKKYQVTVTAVSDAGRGTAGRATLDLTPPAKTLKVGPNIPNGVPVGVRNEPTTKTGGRAGEIPPGYTGNITVHCQVTGERVTREGESTASAIWDRVTWEGKQGWVSDLYIRTTNADAGTYSPGQLWQCT
ncbi:hypothetical protein LO772_26400 [Yinghuangia sp. ASG 101]|uniref:fibronectin type III domain-containing protein n=1 Tax=Yinghuangia sp. ASG 101 TaxID=2896848 RepID=UPI001E5B669F|nr:fibronectin type III domain-containing protein [Yinghuangia sp. ASG 101]UGQ10366.1 hypothetical protein LO772_26400 [Yinghuangia sp. ASG 101]